MLAEPSGRLVASYSLFAAGIAMVILSLTLSPSFGTVRNDPATPAADSSSQLPFLLPALLGSLFAFVGGIRISRFANPWNLVLGGCPPLLALFFLRILGLILSTSGALRLLGGQKIPE